MKCIQSSPTYIISYIIIINFQNFTQHIDFFNITQNFYNELITQDIQKFSRIGNENIIFHNNNKHISASASVKKSHDGLCARVLLFFFRFYIPREK